jgi:DNA invertase Pin-like site-specific DNA recombinase
VESKISTPVIELIRVSTQGQAAEGRGGIPAQREINRRTARIYDLHIVKTIEIVDVSGAAVLASPEMQQLLQLIASPSIRGVVTKEFSRLIRPEKYTDLAILETFIDTKTILFLPDGPIDLSSKSGRFMGTIRAAVAGLERREILDRMQDAKEAIRRAGRHPGGSSTLPLGIGYSNEKGWFHTEDAEKVKEAFRMFQAGSSYTEISKKLNIARSSVRCVLENEIYTGWRVYNQKRDPAASGYVSRKNGRQGYRRKIARAPEEVIRVQVLKGIVQRNDFATVQRLIELKCQKHWRARTGLPERYTYNGFLTCGECGELLYTHTSKQEFYICKTRHTREKRNRAALGLQPCTNKYMLRRKLEPKIDCLIGEKLNDPAFLSRLLEQYREKLPSSSFDVDRSTAQRKIEDLMQRKERILQTFYEGVIDRQQRDTALGRVDREIAAYREILRSATSGDGNAVSTLESALEILGPFAEWEFLPRSDRRALLQQLCPEITVYQYVIKSMMLDLGIAMSDAHDRDNISHSRMDASRSLAQPFP